MKRRGVSPPCRADLQGIRLRHSQFRRSPAQPDQLNPRSSPARTMRPLRAFPREPVDSRPCGWRLPPSAWLLRAAHRASRLRHVRRICRGCGRRPPGRRSVSTCSPTRSSSLRKASRSGSMSAGPAARGAVHDVKDHGRGLPADEIPIVLASFAVHQRHQCSAEQGPASGLPIAKNPRRPFFVWLHGGTCSR